VVVAVVGALALEPLRRAGVRRARRLAFGPEVYRDELLLRLGDTLEHTLDRDALTRSIAETAMEGLGAQWVRLEPRDAPEVHVGRALRPGERPALTSPLLHGHDDLGRISCGPASGGRGRSRIQLQTLARQVAMALTNARLADQLNAQLAEIDASRQRLVTAEETARRRLERDLHDGAQQDLAALLTRIALARNQLGRADVTRLDTTLATLHADAGEALRNLRELVSGIHEATLADQGLVAAVQGRAAKLPIPVEVSCGPGVRAGRFAATVESTAFFTVCEALANTLKHAGAQRASIALTLDGGSLRIEVADDGRGFDPDATTTGSRGLTGLRDRIAAVGGTFAVRSAPGAGTMLTAVVPAVAP
jgi:signal transduction histidine kinase